MPRRQPSRGRAVVAVIDLPRFRDLLIERDLTLGELAQRTGWSQSTLSKLHCGWTVTCSKRLGDAIERVLDAPGELFGVARRDPTKEPAA